MSELVSGSSMALRSTMRRITSGPKLVCATSLAKVSCHQSYEFSARSYVIVVITNLWISFAKASKGSVPDTSCWTCILVASRLGCSWCLRIGIVVSVHFESFALAFLDQLYERQKLRIILYMFRDPRVSVTTGRCFKVHCWCCGDIS